MNYSTIEKELLAIVWATSQFRHYLYGRKFTLNTDHKPLVWLSSLKEPNSKLIRWKIKLNEYEFNICHVQGKDNKVADALSRITCEVNLFECNECNKKYTQATNLGIHKRIVHRNIRFECNICKRLFRLKNSLKQHFKSKHPREKLSYKETNSGDDQGNGPKKIRTVYDNVKRIQSPVPTVHSANEDGSDYIRVTEKPLNYYRKQILLINGNENSYELIEKHDKKRYKFIYKNDKEIIKKIIDIIESEENVAIYCENENIYLKIQDEVVRMRNIKKFEIFRTYKLLEDVHIENLMEIIMRHHKYENNHPGIEKTYQELKSLYYYPNMKREITKIINNCEICNFKIERRPIRLPYEKTETPNGPHEIYHADIWYMSKGNMYLTVIDKFSKYAFVQQIEERTPLCLIKAFTITFNVMKAPKLLITDNETALTTAIFKDFLDKKNIELHLTTPNRHTGNSDIERFHSSLNENIRLYRKREEENDIAYNIDLVVQSNYTYNNTIHLTTKKKPIDIHFSGGNVNLQDVYKQIEETKERTLAYRNKDRKDANVNQEFKKTPNVWKMETRHEKVDVEQIDGKRYKTRNKNMRIYKDQFMKRKNHFRSTDVLVDDNDYGDNQPSTSAEARNL